MRAQWLIPLSQVNQNLVLAGRGRNGTGFEFFGRTWAVCRHAGRSPSAPRLAPDWRHAFAGIVALDDIPVTRRCAPGSSTALRVQRHRPDKQTPLANAARTRRLHSSSRLKLSQRSRPRHPVSPSRRRSPAHGTLYYILTNLGQRDEPPNAKSHQDKEDNAPDYECAAKDGVILQGVSMLAKIPPN